MGTKQGVRFAKHLTYIVTMVLLYVLQTTPGLLEIFGSKPNFVIPAAACIAMLEGEFVGGLYGALAGLLCDHSGYAFFGFNAIILLVACVAAGLLVIYMLRPTIVNYILLLAGVLFVKGLLDYLLNYVMWGYSSVWMVLVYDILPGIIYTLAVSPLVYYLYGWVFRKFQERLES